MSMKMPPRRKEIKPDVQAGLKEIERENKYRYNLWVDKTLMAKYLHLCKMRGTSAPKELAKFVNRELKRFDDLTNE